MPKESKIYEEQNDDGTIILRIEGEEQYYSYHALDRIELKTTNIKIGTFVDENGISEIMHFDAVCHQDWASLAVIGDPETLTKSIGGNIKTALGPEQNFLATIIWSKEEDKMASGYGAPQWGCEIWVPEEYYQKLTEDYRLNRIATLEIVISAALPEELKRSDNDLTPESEFRLQHLWRAGYHMIEVCYSKGDPLYLRPDRDHNCSAVAYATCQWISYSEPPIITDNPKLDDKEEKPQKIDGELNHQNSFSHDELATKISELKSTISDVKKYIKLGVICLFAIAVMLMF